MKKFFLIICLIIYLYPINGQSLSNNIEKEIMVISDSLVIDTLSIVPESFHLYSNGKEVPVDVYDVDFNLAVLYFNRSKIQDSSIFKVNYRVFPFSFAKEYYHKPIKFINDSTQQHYFEKYQLVDETNTFFSSSQLNKSGSISRGISFGNNQNAAVNSDFNLQLSGKISPELTLKANISDNNIPIQSDGTSQQLREFDKVFIELSSQKSKVVFGDFDILKPEGYYMNFNKKVQGARFETNLKGKKNNLIHTSVNTSISKGKNNRQKIQGIEGNQGPYKLEGANQESYVIILSGSEQIFINGEPLTRGNEYDYIIDYNTAELTFTVNRLITKDSRIIAEFEYSEMSYARFVLGSEFKIENDYSTLYMNIYSENDAKNQNIRQDLSDEQKLVLNEIGDQLSQAVVYNITQIDTFNSNEILYRKTDTIVNTQLFQSIYVYSTDSIQASYRLGFSYTGENNGNYIRVQSAVNGKIYQWVSPQNGILQGDYEPVRVLISPKKKQMVNFGGTYRKKNTKVHFETAVTNNDVNTFSDIDDQNNFGFAGKFGLSKNVLKKDTGTTQLNIGANYSFLNRNFNAFEPFKDPEFERDWNIEDVSIISDEHYLTAFLEFKKKNLGQFLLSSEILNKNKNYTGNKNRFKANFQKKRFVFLSDVNRLVSKNQNNSSDYIRYDFTIERRGDHLSFGIKNLGEKNSFYNLAGDSLLMNSFRFNQPEIYLKSPDKAKKPFLLSYSYRDDFLPTEGKLKFYSASHDYKFSAKLINTQSQKLKTSIIYRILNSSDSSQIINTEKTITGRIEHNLNLFKGALSNLIFFEHLSGSEQVKEFTYIEVQSGQGIFVWEDFNQNKIKELNEFVKANFTDEADFIRVSIPTNEYKPVFNQNFNYVLNVNPKRVWYKEKGIKKLVSNFSNKFAYKLNRKINNTGNYYQIQTVDSSLLSLNSMLNNSINLDINKTKTRISFSYISAKNKLLLINGIDTRTNEYYNYFINQEIVNFKINNTFKTGLKSYDSEFFTESNYRIKYYHNHTSATLKIDKKTDLVANFIIKKKTNEAGEENMDSYNIGAEYKLGGLNQGSVIVKFDFIDIRFTGDENSSVSYEILEGLKSGNNYVWSVLWYKKISQYLQLELNYSGRKSEANKTIHSGGMSIRAIF